MSVTIQDHQADSCHVCVHGPRNTALSGKTISDSEITMVDGYQYHDFEQAMLGPVFIVERDHLPQRTGHFPDRRMIDLIEQAVVSVVTTVANDGWTPVDPVDAAGLWQANRVTVSTEPVGLLRRKVQLSLSSVRVRFRKPVR